MLVDTATGATWNKCTDGEGGTFWCLVPMTDNLTGYRAAAKNNPEPNTARSNPQPKPTAGSKEPCLDPYNDASKQPCKEPFR